MATNNAINNLNFNNVTAISSITTLAASAYGREVICTGSSAYTVTLPTVTNNANKFIDIFAQTTSHALITISPASGTIAGQTTLVIGSGDGVRIMNDGTNWWVLNAWLQPVNFSVTLSADQSIAFNTTTKVTYNTIAYNIGGFYDGVTNYRFTPLLPGKYQITHQGCFAPGGSGAFNNVCFISKNNSIVATGVTTSYQDYYTTLYTSIVLPFNGSTDYSEADVNTGNIGGLSWGSAYGIFNGFRVSLF